MISFRSLLLLHISRIADRNLDIGFFGFFGTCFPPLNAILSGVPPVVVKEFHQKNNNNQPFCYKVKPISQWHEAHDSPVFPSTVRGTSNVMAVLIQYSTVCVATSIFRLSNNSSSYACTRRPISHSKAILSILIMAFFIISAAEACTTLLLPCLSAACL